MTTYHLPAVFDALAMVITAVGGVVTAVLAARGSDTPPDGRVTPGPTAYQRQVEREFKRLYGRRNWRDIASRGTSDA